MSLVIKAARLRLRAKIIVVFTLIGALIGLIAAIYHSDVDFATLNGYVTIETRQLSQRAQEGIRSWGNGNRVTDEERRKNVRELAPLLGLEGMVDEDGWLINPYAEEVNKLFRAIAMSMAIGAALGSICGMIAPIGAPDDIRSGSGGGSGGAGGIVRGVEVVDAKTLARLTKKEADGITIAGVPIPAEREKKHFLISGSTGVGKSVAISEMLDGANERADRALIADVGGLYCEQFYNPARGDLIINPFDARDVGWSPLAEIREPHDAIRIAKTIIPDGSGESENWNKYARTFLSSMLQCAIDNNLQNADLQEMAFHSNSAELRKRLAKYPVRQMLEESNDKMLASVRAVVVTYCEPLSFLDPNVGADGFSMRDFVESNSGGWVFLTARDSQLESMKTFISAIVDMATVGVLSRNPGDARFWLVLDELASFGKITGLHDFLTKARKYGGRGVIGIQTVAQLRDIYGDNGAQTMMANASNALILQTVDAETSGELSKLIGDRQIYREDVSQSESARSALSQTRSVSKRLDREPAVLASEIQSLPVLHGYLRLAGELPVARVQLRPRNRPQRAAPAFVPTDRPAWRIFDADEADSPDSARDNPGGNSGGKPKDDDDGLYL